MSSGGERSTEEKTMNDEIISELTKRPVKNDVFSKEFDSKIDDYFTSKTKEKDHGTRAASIKIGGQWT